MLVFLAALFACGSDSGPEEASIDAPTAVENAAAAHYSCPMHPDITSAEAGSCATCGMALVEQKHPDGHDHGSHEH